MIPHNKFQTKLRYYTKWTGISVLVGLLSGSASSLFLAALELATRFREVHPWLIWLLPIGGLFVGWMYHSFGRSVEAGNNLLLDEIHDPKATIPLRMVPLVLFGTVLTHFFGGSAGREGTAVQMGGSLADQLSQLFRLNPDERRTLLMTGMSAGFGSVFGVPFAGALFGLEVLVIGRLRARAIIECIIASFVGHYTTLAWGIRHTDYLSPLIPEISLHSVFWTALAGIAFGVCALGFSSLSHLIGRMFKKLFNYGPVRPMVGGMLVALGFWALGTTRYAGLGIPVIEDSLRNPLPVQDFALKLFFTALTLGSGFKGGEVTPLLFIGATLGNALGQLFPVSFSLLAAVGFVAVFAGAANTPLACTVMAMEIFGTGIGVFAAIGCFISYQCSGHNGIYRSQRIHARKSFYIRRISGPVRSLFTQRRRPEKE